MKEKILLVDDETGICKVLGISLQDRGYELFTAENGRHALEIFESICPPIVITDIKMPGMDGIELLRQIKKRSPDTEVVMITGHGDIHLAIKSLKYEATDFITKPISEDALDVALKRVSERMAMRRQLAAYTENLEFLVREKSEQLIEAERMAAIGETVAGLSHTIKSIAGGLRGGSFVLEKGIELKEQSYLKQGWDMVRGNVERVTQLSLDLLDYAKFSGADFQMWDPNRPLREVFQLLSPVARERRVELHHDLAENLGTILLDADGMNRCLLNLVNNAIEACTITIDRKEPPQVWLQSRSVEGWGVEYQVRDNGVGMDEKTKRNLFKCFFSTKGSGGTGIGLMMSKKIIDLHHGQLDVVAGVEIGTSVIIRLPECQPSTDLQTVPS